MTEVDVDLIAHGLLQDAKLIGCATPEQLGHHLTWLEEAQDEIARAVEKAVQPLLKKAVDDIYGGLLDTTQDYLKDNLAFNIASRISAAEREAAYDRERFHNLLQEVIRISDDFHPGSDREASLALQEMRDALISAITKARGAA